MWCVWLLEGAAKWQVSHGLKEIDTRLEGLMASNKSRVLRQVHMVFERLKAFGQCKDRYKKSALKQGREFYAFYEGKIFSIGTFKTYKPKAMGFVRWCFENGKIKNLYDIKHGMVREYYEMELSKLKPNTVKTHLAAITKLAEGMGRPTGFRRVSQQIQQGLEKVEVSRPTYASREQVEKVVEYVGKHDGRYGLAMKVQLETACRICEVDRLRLGDLVGISTFEFEQVGVLSLRGKGGRERQVYVSVGTYQELEKALGEQTKLISYNGYRAAVRRGSLAAGLYSGGTHKARRFSVQQFVREGYRELRQQGLSSSEASRNMLHEANRILGHSPGRTSTAKLYLRKR
jgi:site-specific recombinase XerD